MKDMTWLMTIHASKNIYYIGIPFLSIELKHLILHKRYNINQCTYKSIYNIHKVLSISKTKESKVLFSLVVSAIIKFQYNFTA